MLHFIVFIGLMFFILVAGSTVLEYLIIIRFMSNYRKVDSNETIETAHKIIGDAVYETNINC